MALIRGILTDAANGEPLPFGVVLIDGTDQGATADANGFFILNVNPGNHNITARYVGYYEQKIPNVYVFNDRSLNIKLKPKTTQLTETTVTAKKTYIGLIVGGGVLALLYILNNLRK